MEISNFSENIAGPYRCVAENAAGRVEHTVAITAPPRVDLEKSQADERSRSLSKRDSEVSFVSEDSDAGEGSAQPPSFHLLPCATKVKVGEELKLVAKIEGKLGVDACAVATPTNCMLPLPNYSTQ